MAKKENKASWVGGGAMVAVLAVLKSGGSVFKLFDDGIKNWEVLAFAIGAGVILFAALIIVLFRRRLRPKRLRDQTSVPTQQQDGYLAPETTRTAAHSKLWLVAVFWGAAALVAMGYALVRVLS